MHGYSEAKFQNNIAKWIFKEDELKGFIQSYLETNFLNIVMIKKLSS